MKTIGNLKKKKGFPNFGIFKFNYLIIVIIIPSIICLN
jgi:hypothetical protein